MKTVGFGMIGCGMISEIHAKAISEIEGAKVVAGYDPAAGRAKAFGEKFGCRGYDNLEEFLNDPELDAVFLLYSSKHCI